MKKLFLILALGLSLLFLGCIQQPAAGTSTGGETVTKYVCADGKTIVTDITACPTLPSTGQPQPYETELSVCYGMPSISYGGGGQYGGSLEDLCIVGVAAKVKDTSLCKKLSKEQRLTCYAIVADQKNDPDVCLEAESSMVDQCYNQYATNKKDASICDKITEINSKDSCYSQLASQLYEPALCDKMKNPNMKDSCYFSTAMQSSNSSYCNKIINSGMKENCQNNLAQQQAGDGQSKQIPAIPA